MFRTLLMMCLIALSFMPALGQTDGPIGSPQDRRLKITKRTSVTYPSAAQKDHVYGPVTVAVIFQSDGTIGEVRCINEDTEETRKLIKYGVVDAFLDVARKIEFEPEIKGGKAVTVAKKIEYTYSIY